MRYIFICLMAGIAPNATLLWGQGTEDNLERMLQEGFARCAQGSPYTAEAKWSEALRILKASPNTDKRQADNLVKMGNALRRLQEEKDAMAKFSRALALYRGIADIEGQKTCIASIEEISPTAMAVLGKHVYTEPIPAEERLKFDRDGHLVGKEPTKEEAAFFTDALIAHLESKQVRTDEEEKTLKSLRAKKR
jgi:tetratricopeptide (TPR) repeat protein